MHIHNSLLCCLPDKLLNRLQIILTAADHLLTKTPKHDHITPILKQIHWLHVSQRITYKVMLLVFKSLHVMAPSCIKEMLMQKPISSMRSLRSDNQNLLVVPWSRTATYGDRDFRVYSPTLWNRKPVEMRKCDTVSSFKSLFKDSLVHNCLWLSLLFICLNDVCF